VKLGVVQAGLREPHLRGASIGFAYVDNAGVRREFTGQVSGGKMEGGFRDDKGGDGKWSATKK